MNSISGLPRHSTRQVTAQAVVISVVDCTTTEIKNGTRRLRGGGHLAKCYISETLKTPVTHECDCLIAGGGFAGIASALAAARTGADVLLLEREYILGGLGTAGIVTIYLPLCDGNGNQVTFGIAEELFHLSIKDGAEEKYPDAWLSGDSQENKEKRKTQRFEVQYNPHLFALNAEKLLLENGVRILYGTSVCATEVKDGKISDVIIENKSGRSAVKVNKSVVDCTGDADIAHLSGENTETFKMGNSLAAWHYSVSISRGLSLHMVGVSDSADDIANGKSTTSLINRRFYGIDGDENSLLTQKAHEHILKDIHHNKLRDPSHVPVTIPTIPQLRMTRRISGVYTLSDKEMHKHFCDSVGLFPDWRKRGPVYELPFSTLYGKNVKNLITAGRCISVTDNMWDISRVIPVCALSGQAAGTAAAICDDFSRIDIKALQDILLRNGVMLHKD